MSSVPLGEALDPEFAVLQHSLEPVFTLPAPRHCLPPLLSLPPCQALAMTTIGSDTLPMATSNLFKHWKLNVSQEGSPGQQPSPPSSTKP